VLRTGSARLSGLKLLLGTTQTEDGSVCLVLSPSVCARTALAGTAGRVEAPSGEQEQAPPRVLVVEDTVTTRELERSVLLAAGYDVVVAVDGQQGWEMLQAHDFDAVVSDINMPRMDGIALCRMIRGSRRHAELPVVLVTSLHSDSDRRRGVEAGADAYLTKQGFDRAELVATLERLL
jgi:two-component system chemotaxis sensor kinase CheA